VITKQKQLFYMVGDKFFKTLIEAQKHDLALIINDGLPCPTDESGNPIAVFNAEHDEMVERVSLFLIKYATPIVDILTTTPTSRAKARKNNGAVKPKAKKQKIIAATIPEA
jgi:hypothetical protein